MIVASPSRSLGCTLCGEFFLSFSLSEEAIGLDAPVMSKKRSNSQLKCKQERSKGIKPRISFQKKRITQTILKTVFVNALNNNRFSMDSKDGSILVLP